MAIHRGLSRVTDKRYATPGRRGDAGDKKETTLDLIDLTFRTFKALRIIF